MNKRRWTLLGLNLVLATAILVQPTEASWACDFDTCICACLADWDECDEGGGDNCDEAFDECRKDCKKVW